MRKIIITAALALATAAMAAPANADNANWGGGVTGGNNWTFSPAPACLSGAIGVPILSGYLPVPTNKCGNGNVIDHFGF
ncbi:hypothetical protein AQI88_34265 [Streptomyces cellostaticus]|uniref:Chaplin domain-containing protein n=1 Tax=Streptomyces cellostaticus TaxID=67285 RepID=A0A101NF73_9ACTN|nr:hypothetical protein [Streptomyces cellostaticus]KUM92051.1 hypothetical protein AQI88_34265 [Streptomyces cellostaticus]GHI07765.1 hypothetical protein Scel_60860 [Streptomyces cellostaticus]